MREECKSEYPARVEIYALCDPESGEIRYIGKANDSEKRLKSHLADMYRRDYPVYFWLRKMIKRGAFPSLKILSVTNSLEWREEEIRQINKYRGMGCRLLNVADGGDMPYCPIEIRRANGQKNAKIIHSDPKRRQLWFLKKRMGDTLLWLKNNNKAHYNNIVLKLHIAAMKCPEKFGGYAKLKTL